MAAHHDTSPSDQELEQLWSLFHRCWVAASEELARAEQGAREYRSMDSERLVAFQQEAVDVLRRQESQCRAMLEQYEARMHRFRSRAAAYRAGYCQPA